MPSALTYPGVYVEELPSGVRTITGVATSIAAFVGRAVRGEVDVPSILTSWEDFERRFGGIADGYPMGYAVRDFFQNGGATAVVVRLFAGDKKVAKIEVQGLKLQATSPGAWGDTLRVRIDQEGVPAADLGTLFNLTVRDTNTGQTESYSGLTVADKPRRYDRILAASSSLLRAEPGQPLAATKPGNHDPLAAADTPADIWKKDAYSDDVTTKSESAGDEIWITKLDPADSGLLGNADNKTGVYAFENTDLFNILVLTPHDRTKDVPDAVYQTALTYCVKRRAMLIVDPPVGWKDANDIAKTSYAKLTALNINGDAARNAAIYFPRVRELNPANGAVEVFPASGMIAGVWARTDVARGVWKAPAGVDAALSGAQGLANGNDQPVYLTDGENGLLNPVGINCLRQFPIVGRVIWGARTMRGADASGDDYKYIPVRRLALFIEESLYRGLKWVVFEPNDEPLWAQIRLNVGAFMHNLFRQGAFQGSSPRDAFFVKCDGATTTQNDINLGIVNIIVGFAPLKPAEFVVLKIQQIAGEIQA
jgi:phage tail sheath protein FI